VLTSRAWDTTVADPGGRQRALVKALVATGKPVIVVAVRDPYDLTVVPEVSTYLATYGYAAVSMESLAKVLLGTAPPRGKLPVEIPGLYPYGHGLTWRVR